MTDDLDEIFGIPVPEKKNEDSEGSEEAAFSDTMNDANGIAFDEQASKVDKVVSDMGRTVGNIYRKNNDGKSKIQDAKDGSNADEADSYSNARKEEHNSLGDAKKASKNVHEEKVDSSKPTPVVGIAKASDLGIFNSFVITSKDTDLDNFYNIKQDALASWLLPGGAMNFSALMDEIRQARPDLSKVVFGDMKSMFVALNHIQKWKDRITSIQIDVNQQYYAWKRAIELFRGVLARCRYEKPSERQEGVVMEHMGDLIVYMSKLESIHASVSAVAENLDNAFDCISRQITTSVTTMNKDVDMVERKTGTAMANSSDVGEYDTVDSPKSSVKNKPSAYNKSDGKISKAGTIDWI